MARYCCVLAVALLSSAMSADPSLGWLPAEMRPKRAIDTANVRLAALERREQQLPLAELGHTEDRRAVLLGTMDGSQHAPLRTAYAEAREVRVSVDRA